MTDEHDWQELRNQFKAEGALEERERIRNAINGNCPIAIEIRLCDGL